jgi:flagellar L-ring protein FlgH
MNKLVPLSLSAFVVALLLQGCSSNKQALAVKAPEQVRILPKPPAIRDGSLWQEDSAAAASLTSDVKARAKGDIVRILVVEKIDARRARNTSTSKSQDINAGIEDITFPGAGPVLGAAASIATGGNREFRVGASSKRNFEGGGSVSDTGTVQATVTAQVVEVLPNGNLFLCATKEVTVGGETQVVTLTGIARTHDVTPENTVLSTNLAEARVNISGSGPLDDAQRRTLVTRVLDWINLF